MEFEQFEAGLTMIAGEDLLKLIAQRDAHREKVAALEATVAYLLMKDSSLDAEAAASQLTTLTKAIAKHPVAQRREQELKIIDQLMWISESSEEFHATPIPDVYGQPQVGDRPPAN